jgi:hypothetical protein
MQRPTALMAMFATYVFISTSDIMHQQQLKLWRGEEAYLLGLSWIAEFCLEVFQKAVTMGLVVSQALLIVLISETRSSHPSKRLL